MKNKSAKWGGAREGAGRKGYAKTKERLTKTFVKRCTESEYGKLQEAFERIRAETIAQE